MKIRLSPMIEKSLIILINFAKLKSILKTQIINLRYRVSIEIFEKMYGTPKQLKYKKIRERQLIRWQKYIILDLVKKRR
jgi:hypothetical protein